jgi:hypothetical protein
MLLFTGIMKYSKNYIKYYYNEIFIIHINNFINQKYFIFFSYSFKNWFNAKNDKNFKINSRILAEYAIILFKSIFSSKMFKSVKIC